MAKQKNTKSDSASHLQTRPAPRNPFSDHPLMRKGGVHEKSKKAKRASARRETKQLVRDWRSICISFN